MTPSCTACGRPVAMTQPRCLYCGAPLSETTQAKARAAAQAVLASPVAATGSPRAFVVFDPAGADPAGLARALGLARFEADLRRRRGGPQLHRILPVEQAAAEAARLVGLGVQAAAIPESDTLAARTPRVASAAARPEGALVLRLETGSLTVSTPELRLVVRGPIAREYQSRGSARHQIRTATLESGYRFQLHFTTEPRPVEIDTGSCELGAGAWGSTLLTVSGWLKELGVPEDDGFRWLTPALAPEAAAGQGVVRAAEPLRPRAAGTREEAVVVLDNLLQFRVYSGWRSAFAAHARG